MVVDGANLLTPLVSFVMGVSIRWMVDEECGCSLLWPVPCGGGQCTECSQFVLLIHP